MENRKSGFETITDLVLAFCFKCVHPTFLAFFWSSKTSYTVHFTCREGLMMKDNTDQTMATSMLLVLALRLQVEGEDGEMVGV